MAPLFFGDLGPVDFVLDFGGVVVTGSSRDFSIMALCLALRVVSGTDSSTYWTWSLKKM